MASLRSVAAVVAVVIALASTARAQMSLQLLNGTAKCLDASPSGYYFQKSATGSDNWVIFLQGGGVCHTIEGCIGRSKTALGSSKHWASTRTDTNNLLSTNCTFNPFCNDNHAFVPYCSGDVYLGQETKPDQFGLTFAGHLTVGAVIADLKTRHGLGSGTGHKLLLAGSSAGGLGTFTNADYVTGLLPSVEVKAAPQGGFFFPNVTAYPYWAAGKFAYPESSAELGLFDAFRDESCVKAVSDPVLCDDMFTLYPFITTPLFVAENQYDSNQIFAQLQAPETNTSEVREYITYFGFFMRQGLSQVKAPNGLYAPSCLCHTSDLNLVLSPTVGGYTMATGLSDWYFKGASVNVVDDCGTSPCNPGCAAACTNAVF